MTDKIYTRNRIRIPNFKSKKVNPVKFSIYLIFLILIGIVTSFIYAAFPIFKASCESAAGSKATNITNEAVMEIMESYTYNDLMNIQKDGNGKINLLEANIVTINQVIAKIVSKIQKEIDNAPRTTVFINMGSITGISVFNTVGPQFDIELETAGRIISNVKTEFIDLNTNIGILTPYGNFSRNFETSVLLTQAIIVGEVPETYYDFNGSYTNEEDVAMEAM